MVKEHVIFNKFWKNQGIWKSQKAIGTVTDAELGPGLCIP